MEQFIIVNTESRVANCVHIHRNLDLHNSPLGNPSNVGEEGEQQFTIKRRLHPVFSQHKVCI